MDGGLNAIRKARGGAWKPPFMRVRAMSNFPKCPKIAPLKRTNQPRISFGFNKSFQKANPARSKTKPPCPSFSIRPSATDPPTLKRRLKSSQPEPVELVGAQGEEIGNLADARKGVSAEHLDGDVALKRF